MKKVNFKKKIYPIYQIFSNLPEKKKAEIMAVNRRVYYKIVKR